MRGMQFNLNSIKRCVEDEMGMKMSLGLGLAVGPSKRTSPSSLVAKQTSGLILGAGNGPSRSSKCKEPILASGIGPFRAGWRAGFSWVRALPLGPGLSS